VNLTPAHYRWTTYLLGLLAAGGLVLLYFYNPSKYGFYPICEFHRITGWNCPGCGGTRALYALLHGKFQVAFHDNALFLLCFAAGSVRLGWLRLRQWRGYPPIPLFSPWMAWTLLVVTVAFGVVRNLPGFEWLSPS
jgi:hypothetical protein